MQKHVFFYGAHSLNAKTRWPELKRLRTVPIAYMKIRLRTSPKFLETFWIISTHVGLKYKRLTEFFRKTHSEQCAFPYFHLARKTSATRVYVTVIQFTPRLDGSLWFTNRTQVDFTSFWIINWRNVNRWLFLN